MALKTVRDSQHGTVDVFVTDGPLAAGSILPGSTAIVAGKVSASAGINFLVSGSGMATTCSLPAITVADIGTQYTVLADSLAVTVTASNPLTTAASAWTAGVAAYGKLSCMAVSGALGYYYISL